MGAGGSAPIYAQDAQHALYMDMQDGKMNGKIGKSKIMTGQPPQGFGYGPWTTGGFGGHPYAGPYSSVVDTNKGIIWAPDAVAASALDGQDGKYDNKYYGLKIKVQKPLKDGYPHVDGCAPTVIDTYNNVIWAADEAIATALDAEDGKFNRKYDGMKIKVKKYKSPKPQTNEPAGFYPDPYAQWGSYSFDAYELPAVTPVILSAPTYAVAPVSYDVGLVAPTYTNPVAFGGLYGGFAAPTYTMPLAASYVPAAASVVTAPAAPLYAPLAASTYAAPATSYAGLGLGAYSAFPVTAAAVPSFPVDPFGGFPLML